MTICSRNNLSSYNKINLRHSGASKEIHFENAIHQSIFSFTFFSSVTPNEYLPTLFTRIKSELLHINLRPRNARFILIVFKVLRMQIQLKFTFSAIYCSTGICV